MKIRTILFTVLLIGTASVRASDIENSSPPAGQKFVAKDPLDWLGPMPEKINPTVIKQRMNALASKLHGEVFAEIDLTKFVCKTPAEVGPIPRMDAVNRYLLGWPESRRNPVLLGDLFDAASQGNWLARSQIFANVIESDTQDLKMRYRWLQLAEWMYQQRLGPVFTWYVDQLAASGLFGPQADLSDTVLFAAIQNSYSAQDEAGKNLMLYDYPEHRAIGKAMRACAANALPGYRKIFERTDRG